MKNFIPYNWSRISVEANHFCMRCTRKFRPITVSGIAFFRSLDSQTKIYLDVFAAKRIANNLENKMRSLFIFTLIN